MQRGREGGLPKTSLKSLSGVKLLVTTFATAATAVGWFGGLIIESWWEDEESGSPSNETRVASTTLKLGYR